ncbi:MAG TPA: hypothetical protein VHZ32_00620 [Rhizomicrobium sp.]|jgi:hypothetical protein|nr:hypothetical protein [Rhizomicrobium sp.]
MREFVILVQSILLRPANAETALTPAIGLIAPATDLRDQFSFADATVWFLQHLPAGLTLLLPLMAALMIYALIKKRSLPGVPALAGSRAVAPARRSNRFASGIRHTTKDDRTASAPVL